MTVSFSCLIVKTFKGTSVRKQTEIVQSLGGVQNNLVWTITCKNLDEVKRVEAVLINKVPYGKVIS